MEPTLRLLSISAGDSVTTMLRAFGSPQLPERPVVFSEKYEANWRQFVEKNDFSAPDQNSKTLYTILEFVKYMRANRMNPFAKVVQDPVSHSRIDPSKIYKRLVTEQLRARIDQVDRYTKTYGLLSYLDIKQTVVRARMGKEVTVTSLSVLKTKRTRDTLNSVLQKLRGTLYPKEVPIQLLDVWAKNKSLLPLVNKLIADNGDFGWLLLDRREQTSLALRRAKGDILVFRAQTSLPIHVNLGTKPDTVKFIQTTWKSLKGLSKL